MQTRTGFARLLALNVLIGFAAGDMVLLGSARSVVAWEPARLVCTNCELRQLAHALQMYAPDFNGGCSDAPELTSRTTRYAGSTRGMPRSVTTARRDPERERYPSGVS